MAEEILMPKLSDSMEEGRIVKWLRNEGDKVSEGDIIVEVESDKSVMDVESFNAGSIMKIVHGDGDVVRVGEVIAFIGEEGESVDAPVKSSQKSVHQEKDVVQDTKKEVSKEELVPTCLTPFHEDDETRLKISPAAKAAAAKKSIDISSIKGSGPEGRIVLEDIEGGDSNVKSQKTDPVQKESAIKVSKDVNIEPLAKVLVDKHKLDVSKIHGTGSNGRITINDVSELIAVPEPEPKVKDPAVDLPPISFKEGEAEVEDASFYELAASRRVTASKHVIPHFYVTNSIDATALLREKEEHRSEFNATITHMLIKAVAKMTEKYPRANWSYDRGKFIKWNGVNVGIAVKSEAGLVVAVLKDADKKELPEIVEESKGLIERARKGRLKPEERSNPGFTISNLGMFNVDNFSAIINPPSACTLAVASAINTPVVKDGKVEIAKIMKLTLSADHRVIDGVMAAEILVELKRLLEDPHLIFPK